MDDHLHRKYTGVSNKQILENLVFLSVQGAEIRIRYPLVPGINDTPEQLGDLATFLEQLPRPVEGIDILPYHALCKRGQWWICYLRVTGVAIIILQQIIILSMFFRVCCPSGTSSSGTTGNP